jgi:hypothetical protein
MLHDDHEGKTGDELQAPLTSYSDEVNPILGTHPPHARFAFRVGVTGHRPKDLTNAKLDILNERILKVLAYLRDLAVSLSQAQSYYTNPGKPIMRVISALAEGADRNIADQALKLGFELQCPLPFDRDEYSKDFHSKDSLREFNALLRHKLTTAVLELDGTRDREAESYEAAGHLVLTQSDVLVAVWNGEMRNKKGGTSEIVRRALRHGVPVVWINSQAPHEVSVSSSGSGFDPWESGSSLLKAQLETSMLAPDTSKDHDLTTTPKEYFSETQPRWNWGCLWLPFRDFLGEVRFRWPWRRLPKFAQSGPQQWNRIMEDSGAFSEQAVQLVNRTRLLEHYGWADGLATYYGNLYRSAFVFNYLLGAFAVAFAFLHFVSDKRQFSFAEVVTLVLIIGVYWYGRHRRWHDRWIDYRLLAECLRQMIFLIPLGPAEISSPHLPKHMASGDPKTSWMYWHYRAIGRAIGTVGAKFDSEYLERVRSFLASKEAIDGQAEYHDTNARRFRALDHRVTVVGLFLFSLAGIAAFSSVIERNTSAAIAFAATVFPAFGAALAGVRSQGEFERVKKRSEAMHDELKRQVERLETLRNGAAPISSTILGTIVAESGQLMLDELLDWRIVFRDRPFEPPS